MPTGVLAPETGVLEMGVLEMGVLAPDAAPDAAPGVGEMAERLPETSRLVATARAGVWSTESALGRC